MSAQCDGLYTDFDLTEKTLVGFRTIISDFDSGDRRNIKTICPIVQELDCGTASIQAELDPFEHEIGSGEHNHDIEATTHIQFSGEITTSCGDYSYALQDDAPDYITLSGNTLTVNSGTYDGQAAVD